MLALYHVYCFHSFEVGFGQFLPEDGWEKVSGFHSFEVGFGQFMYQKKW